jgi:two-component system, cell cycle sensor histidine kinase and response regulator CckA
LPSKDGAARAAQALSHLHRVLVVEDEEAVAEGLRLLLEHEYDVDVASSGQQALELLLCGKRFDAVLCDLMMPGMSGIQLFEALKLKAPGLEQRLVFMTGGAFTPEAETFLDEISNARVEKPFDFAKVDRLLRLAASSGSSTK